MSRTYSEPRRHCGLSQPSSECGVQVGSVGEWRCERLSLCAQDACGITAAHTLYGEVEQLWCLLLGQRLSFLLSGQCCVVLCCWAVR